MEKKHKDSIAALKRYLENMTPEQKKEMEEHFRDDRPKGWLSIEDHLPMMFANDIMKGYSEFKVRLADGTEGGYACDGPPHLVLRGKRERNHTLVQRTINTT